MSKYGGTQDEGLLRAIGVRALGISIVNLVVGGGIFVLPGLIAARHGRNYSLFCVWRRSTY